METERLIINAIKETDRQDYFENISHDRKVLETFICNYAERPEEIDMSRYVNREDMSAIRLKSTGKLIGIILYFDVKGDSCEIGYGIGSGYWNKGYGSEAVRKYVEYLKGKGFNKIYASYFEGNDASKRVMEKCGMRYDHINKKELTYQGIERDLTYYSTHNSHEGKF